MAEHTNSRRHESGTTIRRPTRTDWSEGPVVAAVRESGELVEETTRDVRTASSGIARGIFFLVVLPAIALPALMTVGSTQPWYSGSILAAYLPMFVLAALAWHYCFAPEWRGRLRRKSERLYTLEDSSALRREMLENPIRRALLESDGRSPRQPEDPKQPRSASRSG